jgi:hypothetical protein
MEPARHSWQHCCLAFASLALLASACASTIPQSPAAPEPTAFFDEPAPSLPAPPPPPAKVEPAPPQPCTIFAKPGVVKRVALLRLIDAGLPRWMQGVEGDRALANHRFQGWLIKSLYPGDPCYQEIDLRAGDVVQKVNGKSIEKPEQAFDVLESLRTAPAITVDFLREGKPQRITIAVADE